MTLPLIVAAPAIARFGQNHGYRFENDRVTINAELNCDLSGLCGQEWALQLWAGNEVKVAELALGALYPNGYGFIAVAGETAALPPAGSGEHMLQLAIVSGRDGIFDVLHDLVAYPQPEQFLQPRLAGTVGCSFLDDHAIIDLAVVENPRSADNLSGTLALEVWSLDAPYTGGGWTGVPVASVVIGTLVGQSAWERSRFIAHAGPVPTSGHLTLMLREWTAAGYITRDYRSLVLPSSPSQTVTAPTVSATAKPEKPAKAPAKGSKTSSAKPATKQSVKSEEPAGLVSVNSATAADITAVKGISDAVAAAIVAARPYASLDELVRAKGMGPKLLEKIRASFKL